MALELRPTCEACAKPLPPEATDARICSYECTFCADCVRALLTNVCPNCGGGFEARPVRPVQEWRAGVSRTRQPPSDRVVRLAYDADAVRAFAAGIRDIAPERR